MGNLSDRVAVVTGAGRGIGRAIAESFAAQGAKVAVVSRSESSCGGAAEAINAVHPDSAKAYAVDVADPAAVEELGKSVLADFGKVDILVNNAGLTRALLAILLLLSDDV